ncbi:MAG: protein kinase [Acidobacteria bacterium]|nr:protein kinase [Acidobacteriota bacterium]
MNDIFLGKTLAEKYRIDSVMRETDLGKVYHGRHLLMDKPVAVKILSPALAVDENIVKRFSAEARSISKISHPNILNVLDFGSDADGAVYIVYEDAEGETLRDAIVRDGKFTPERTIGVTKQIAGALAAAHFKGVVHRSLNAENVLLTLDDSVKVLDLGTVKTDEAPDDEAAPERIEYLSPEQCADASTADERSDIYSLGVMMYEMLAGEVPFRADSTSELMMKHAQEPPPPLSAFRQDLPPTVEPLVLQALAKNPEMRHQTAAELIDDLNHVGRTLADYDTAAAKAAAGKHNIWKTAFVVLAGISLLSIALIWATSSKQTNPSTLQSDTNAQPVQPINPATGMNEQGLATIVPISPEMMSNSNMSTMQVPETLGSDGNPYWQTGRVPPGAPQYVPQGGQYIDPYNPNSPFNPDDKPTYYQDANGAVFMIVPSTPNANANVKPTPGKTPKNAANANVQPTPAPNETPKPQTSPTPDVKTTPAKTPAATPKPNDKPKTPPSTTRTEPSGQTQNS